VGGFVATLLSGVVSDKWFSKRLDLSCFIFSILAIPALLLLLLDSSSHVDDVLAADSFDVLAGPTVFGMDYEELRACGCLFLLGTSISGPKTLIGLAIRDIVPPSATGGAVGVLGLFGQFGLTLAGSGIALLIDHCKWKYYLHFLMAATVLSTCIFGASILIRKRGEDESSLQKKDD
jgi:sugar phosphate permease